MASILYIGMDVHTTNHTVCVYKIGADGRMYRIPRRFQTSQARKAGIDYKIVDGFIPDY